MGKVVSRITGNGKSKPPPGPSPAELEAKRVATDKLAADKQREEGLMGDELDRKARGRASTLLTGSMGLMDEATSSRRLLGT